MTPFHHSTISAESVSRAVSQKKLKADKSSSSPMTFTLFVS